MFSFFLDEPQETEEETEHPSTSHAAMHPKKGILLLIYVLLLHYVLLAFLSKINLCFVASKTKTASTKRKKKNLFTTRNSKKFLKRKTATKVRVILHQKPLRIHKKNQSLLSTFPKVLSSF